MLKSALAKVFGIYKDNNTQALEKAVNRFVDRLSQPQHKHASIALDDYESMKLKLLERSLKEPGIGSGDKDFSWQDFAIEMSEGLDHVQRYSLHTLRDDRTEQNIAALYEMLEKIHDTAGLERNFTPVKVGPDRVSTTPYSLYGAIKTVQSPDAIHDELLTRSMRRTSKPQVKT